MKTLTQITLLVAFLMAVSVDITNARLLELSPVAAAALPATDDGAGRVVLKFDLSAVSVEEYEDISLAIVDWRIDGVSYEDVGEIEFLVHEVTSAWSTDQIGPGNIPEVSEEDGDDWLVVPQNFLDNDGCYVRLRVTGLVQQWVDGGANHGVSIVVRGVDAQKVLPEVGEARLLIKVSRRWVSRD